MKFFIFALSLLFCLSTNAQQNVPYDAAAYVCPPCNSKCDDLGFAEAGTCQHCGMELVSKEEALINRSNMKQLSIAFYLQPGVEVLDFAGPMEVFSYAGYQVFTVSRTKAPITSQGILSINPDYSIEDAPEADILAFFGGNSGAGFADPAITDWIKKQQNVQYYFSVCTGAFALAKAGLLDGQTATTFHDALEGLENNYPKVKVVKNARYVDNGKVITTAGVSAGIDGALHLVAKLQGFNRARQTAYYMEYDKWTPGDGLVLTKDNPYQTVSSTDHLQDYLGIYEFEKDLKVSLQLNTREQSLEATIGERTFPMYYESEDTFTNVQGIEIAFKRNTDGQILGYKVKGEEGLKKKLDE